VKGKGKNIGKSPGRDVTGKKKRRTFSLLERKILDNKRKRSSK